jgi:hypothetical protein
MNLHMYPSFKYFSKTIYFINMGIFRALETYSQAFYNNLWACAKKRFIGWFFN